MTGPTGRVRVAFAGVAHSHPFVDAVNLSSRDAELVGVWDEDDPERRDAFAGDFRTPMLSELAALLALRPDVVVATPRTARAAEIARACSLTGIPVFANKTVAAGRASLGAWLSAAPGTSFTTSVLRFAPDIIALAADLAPTPPRAIDIFVQHDIAGFLAPARRWQDDPGAGGGTLLTIGIHAWEVLDVLMPGAKVDVLSARVVGSDASASELLGSIHACVGSVPVTITASGVAGPDRYSVRIVTDEGVREVILADDGDALGYAGTADAVLRLAAGELPIAPERTAAVYTNAIVAAEAARSATPGRAGQGNGELGNTENGSAGSART